MPKRPRRRKGRSPKGSTLWALAGFGLLTAVAPLLGAVSAEGSQSPWYRGLRKPAFNPPPALFPPVWTALYALIAFSGYRVYRAPPSPARTRALALWGLQLGLNAAWSPLFFGKHMARAALLDSAALTAAIAAYAATARQVDGTAAVAVAPYLAWSSFATVLNEEIVRQNPRLLTG